MAYATEHNLTDLVFERWGTTPDPRFRQIVTALVKHTHAFVREIEPTPDEMSVAIDFLTEVDDQPTV